MRQLCRRARVHYCDLLGPPDRLDLAGRGRRGAHGAGRARAARRDVLQADRGDRVRGEVRRRRGEGARRGRHGARRRVAYLEDAAVHLPRLPRPQGRERPRRPRTSTPPEELFEIDPAKIVGLTIGAERLADIRTARVKSMGAPRRALRGARSRLLRARGGGEAPQEASLPGHRRVGALRRGDRDADHPARRAAPTVGRADMSDEPRGPRPVRRSGGAAAAQPVPAASRRTRRPPREGLDSVALAGAVVVPHAPRRPRLLRAAHADLARAPGGGLGRGAQVEGFGSSRKTSPLSDMT